MSYKSNYHKCFPYILSIHLSSQSLQFRHSVMSDSLQPHGLQHTRLPCPSLIFGACSNPCPLSRCDAIQPSHPLLSSSPPAFNLSQHWHGLTQCREDFPKLGSDVFVGVKFFSNCSGILDVFHYHHHHKREEEDLPRGRDATRGGVQIGRASCRERV